MLVGDGYAARRTEHVSLHGPIAALVTELLQVPAPDLMEQFTITSQKCGLIVQWVPAVTKDIFVQIVGTRRSVSHFNCAA